MPFQGRGPRQRRTRQRPRYGLNFGVRAARRASAIDAAHTVSSRRLCCRHECGGGHHSSGIGDSAEFARTVVNGGHARLNEVNDARAASGYLQPNGIR
jgi:hypothetical protein